MTWKNHRITTAAMAYAASGDVLFSSLAVLCCTLPDTCAKTFEKHREGLSHWAVLWGTLLAISAYMQKTAQTLPLMLVTAILFGITAHIFQDMLSKSGVPILLPGDKPYGLGLYKTWAGSEYATAAGLVALTTYISHTKGYLSLEHILSRWQAFIAMV